MRWLTGLLKAHRRHRERGSVSLIVAVLFGTGVMLGCAALAVDVGSISAERRQLQNGSDAAALSAAMDCVRDGSCPSAGDTELNSLADKNAEDDATRIARVDGGVPICGQGPDLSPCPDVSGLLGDCVAPSSGNMPANYVRVYTQTEAQDGSTILPYFFGQAIVGGTGTTQQTCSTVAWGPVGSMTATLPVTFSTCEWSAATGGDPSDPASGDYPNGPPYDSSYERIIYLQDKKDGTACDTWNGHDIPGGFGWLQGDSDCGAVVTSGGWAHVDTGNNTPNGCKSLLSDLINSGNPLLYVPIYDCIRASDPGVPPGDGWDCTQGNGNNAYYHIAGFAQFYLTGWHLSGTSYNSPCNGGNRCLSGYFLKGLVSQGEISTDPTTPSFGLSAIKMVG